MRHFIGFFLDAERHRFASQNTHESGFFISLGLIVRSSNVEFVFNLLIPLGLYPKEVYFLLFNLYLSVFCLGNLCHQRSISQ